MLACAGSNSDDARWPLSYRPAMDDHGFVHDDPRTRAYRRSAMVTALGWLAAGGIVLFVALMLLVLM